MSLADLGSIGELVGAIGVIASLIYLAAQIRGARSMARAQNVREIFDGMRRNQAAIAANPELAQVWCDGLADYGSLSPRDRMRFLFLVHDYVLLYRETQIAYREGVLSNQDHERLGAYVGCLLNTPGGSEVWATLGPNLSEDITEGLGKIREGLPDLFTLVPGLREPPGPAAGAP